MLAHVVANFGESLEDLTTGHILKGYNEVVVAFSRMPHCPVGIPDYMMNANHKSLVQMNGKLLQSSSLQIGHHSNSTSKSNSKISLSMADAVSEIGETLTQCSCVIS